MSIDLTITEEQKKIVDNFHKLYHSNGSRTWSGNTSWLGHRILKAVTDLWIYQEIIYETKSDIIIDIGTGDAGCTLYMAHILDLIYDDDLNNGKILSIDTENTNHIATLPKHDRIKYITGNSILEETVTEVRQHIKFPIKENITVILDSNHQKEHVLEELRIYSRFIRPGNYLIVEDTNLSNHPIFSGYEGPWEAVQEFLSNKDNSKKFIIDKDKEKFWLTFNPNGYLKRV